jgi:hypothetical protein
MIDKAESDILAYCGDAKETNALAGTNSPTEPNDNNSVALREGMEFRAPYPFVRTTYTEQDEDGFAEVKSWKPGTRFVERFVYPDHVESDCFADGVGEIILTVVSVHKPGRFPTRVFFTRKWQRPDGREFGKPKCHCVTSDKFKRLAKGYRFDFEIQDQGATVLADSGHSQVRFRPLTT